MEKFVSKYNKDYSPCDKNVLVQKNNFVSKYSNSRYYVVSGAKFDNNFDSKQSHKSIKNRMGLLAK